MSRTEQDGKVWWCAVGIHRDSCFDMHWMFSGDEPKKPAGHDECGWVDRPTGAVKGKRI